MNDLNAAINNARILVVDDNPANVALIQAILTDAGYINVIGITDPRMVSDLIREMPMDLILLDIRMPYLSGFDVMDQLRDEMRDDYLPVLVLTAQTDQETRLQALQSGARDFLTKPFDQTEVLHRIRNMLEVRLLYNERRRQAEVLEQRVQMRTAELQSRNAELEETRIEIIRRLGRAGEYRDNETGMHVVRMSKSCECLALAAGCDPAWARMLLHASPMHDVGKIGIPDRILLKPGKLEGEEWQTMMRHAEIGADIMGDHDSPLMQLARSVALHHHEKWDGSGYPVGLAGEAIPIEGRIAAICDVFDALTSERPYKKAWPVEEAVALIRDQSGKHFDPRLTALFLDILPEILSIRDQYRDESEDGPDHVRDAVWR